MPEAEKEPGIMECAKRHMLQRLPAVRADLVLSLAQSADTGSQDA